MIQAHGLREGVDLPVPLQLALGAAAAVLLTTYLALALTWSRPRPRGRAGRPLPRATRLADAPATRFLLRSVGVLGLLVFLVGAWWGPDDALENPVPTWFYAWFWVGLVPLSLAVGPVWRVLNPLRSIAALLRARRSAPPPPIPGWLQGWPAEAAVLTVLWIELVSDSGGSPRTLGGFAAGYALVHVVAGARYGQQWFARNDGFEVYSALFARAAPLGRGPDGALVLRGPLRALGQEPAGDDPTLLVLVLLGGTAFDGLSATDGWTRALARTERDEYLLLGTVGLIGCIGAAVVSYAAALRLMRRVSRSDLDLYRAFAPALIPVAAGYVVAHYLAFALLQGPEGWTLAPDLGRDLARGLLGVAGGTDGTGAPPAQPPEPAGVALPPWLLAPAQLTAIVGGHLLAVVCTHDRALAVLPPHARLSAQTPLLLLTVAYTMAGLALLVG